MAERGAAAQAQRPGQAIFPLVQFEFGFQIGPADGRYLKRRRGSEEAERVVVIATVAAPPQSRFRSRRPRRVRADGPAPVPSARVTVIKPAAFADADAASDWLSGLSRSREALEREVADAAATLNFVLRAHRAAAVDPYAHELAAAVATTVRVGYGTGDLVADGRFSDAVEVPEPRRRRRRAEVLAPQERLAAILTGRATVGAADELVLRARMDVDAGRPREAALQARIALEALLAELPPAAADLRTDLEQHRTAVAEAASAALDGDPDAGLAEAVGAAVAHMERTLRKLAAGQ